MRCSVRMGLIFDSGLTPTITSLLLMEVKMLADVAFGLLVPIMPISPRGRLEPSCEPVTKWLPWGCQTCCGVPWVPILTAISASMVATFSLGNAALGPVRQNPRVMRTATWCVDGADLAQWQDRYATDRNLTDFPFNPYDGGPSTTSLIGPALPGLAQGQLIDKNYALGAWRLHRRWNGWWSRLCCSGTRIRVAS